MLEFQTEEHPGIPLLALCSNQAECEELSRRLLGPLLKCEEGTTIKLTEQDTETTDIDTNRKYSEEFCLIPDDTDQTIIIGPMGEGDILKLSKSKARLLAELILHQLRLIDEEKREWLKNANIIKFPEPVSYMYQFPGHDAIWLLTEKDIAEKSLEELKTMYEKDREEAQHSAETRKGQRMRKVIC